MPPRRSFLCYKTTNNRLLSHSTFKQNSFMLYFSNNTWCQGASRRRAPRPGFCSGSGHRRSCDERRLIAAAGRGFHRFPEPRPAQSPLVAVTKGIRGRRSCGFRCGWLRELRHGLAAWRFRGWASRRRRASFEGTAPRLGSPAETRSRVLRPWLLLRRPRQQVGEDGSGRAQHAMTCDDMLVLLRPRCI